MEITYLDLGMVMWVYTHVKMSQNGHLRLVHFTVCKFDLNKVLFLLNTVLVLKELTVQYVGLQDKCQLLYLYDGGFGYHIWGTSPQQESGEPVVICKYLTTPH